MTNLWLGSRIRRILGSAALALFLPLALSGVIFYVTQASAQDKKGDQHLIVEITTEKQFQILKKHLNELPPKSFQFTANVKKGNQIETLQLGSFPIEKAVRLGKQVLPIRKDQASIFHSTLTDFFFRIAREKLVEELRAADRAAPFQVKTVAIK